MESRRDRFKELVKEKKLIDSTLAIIHWDLETEAPKKGVELISQMVGYLSLKSYEIFTSKEFLELLEFLKENKEKLPLIERKEIDEISEEVEKIKKIPALEYKEYSELTAKAQSIWEEAREKNDFNL
ncbi:MAG: carboxypeptidase M32, partial [Fusobacteriaceae bacterium]